MTKLQNLKTYIPDAIIILGIILYLSPEINVYHSDPQFCTSIFSSGCPSYNTDWDKLGIILIVIGIDILVRKFLKNGKYKFQK